MTMARSLLSMYEVSVIVPMRRGSEEGGEEGDEEEEGCEEGQVSPTLYVWVTLRELRVSSVVQDVGIAISNTL